MLKKDLRSKVSVQFSESLGSESPIAQLFDDSTKIATIEYSDDIRETKTLMGTLFSKEGSVKNDFSQEADANIVEQETQNIVFVQQSLSKKANKKPTPQKIGVEGNTRSRPPARVWRNMQRKLNKK